MTYSEDLSGREKTKCTASNIQRNIRNKTRGSSRRTFNFIYQNFPISFMSRKFTQSQCDALDR